MEVQSSPAVKRPYDITMSRRTRKQSPCPVQGNDQKPKSVVDDVITTKDVVRVMNAEVKEGGGGGGGGESDHKSLKQLIIGDDAKKVSRNSLGEHFSEEEKQQHLQIVRMQQKDNIQGLNFKKLVRRYAKVLGHLMKAKRDPHNLGDAAKKPVFKLST
ncbi:hypothetical protein RJT34_27676 [Clitoria ternatea]|uniref:Uncharacterized protein n=1 Tax=Clitoria ternatea TaxID=43366 RepID=A0AAN9FA17_CLITE